MGARNWGAGLPTSLAPARARARSRSSAFSRARNSRRGRSHRVAAIWRTSFTPSSSDPAGASDAARISSMRRSTRSLRSFSGMALSEFLAQVHQAAELELLHRALRAPEIGGDV